MRFGPPVRILAAAGLLALALTGLVVRENIARDQGQEVRLALAGYDPRSLLQGHYVRFQLRDVRPGAPCPPGSGRRAAEAADWVALRREGSHHVVAGAAASRVEAARLGEVVVRGRLSCFTTGRTRAGDDGDSEDREDANIDLDLDVDRIHLNQEKAQAVQADLQRAPPDGAPPGYAVLSVSRDGKARVKGLIVGARRVDLGWF